MKIGVSGCSHSSRFWGNPWHHYMGVRLNAEIIESSSPGAGNEMNVEKVKFILDNNPDLDLFVLQVTEPARLVMGLSDMIQNNHSTWNTLIDGTSFNGLNYYTFNPTKNDHQLKSLIGVDLKADDFILNYSITSNYNLNYKVFHTLMSIQHLCDFYGKKVIFFSWFVDLHEIAKNIGYNNIIEKMNILQGFVDDYVIKNGLQRIPNNGHFDSENSEKIYEGFIHNQLIKFLK